MLKKLSKLLHSIPLLLFFQSGVVSLIIGLLSIYRDRLIVQSYNAGPVSDMFFLCLALPLYFIGIIQSLTSSAFLPTYIQRMHTNADTAQHLVGSLATLHLMGAGLIICLSLALYPLLRHAWDDAIPAALSTQFHMLYAIMLLIILFGAFSTLLTHMIQAHGHILHASLFPVLPLLTTIGALWLTQSAPHISYAVGGMVAGFAAILLLSLAYNIWQGRRHIWPRRPEWSSDLHHILHQYRYVATGVLFMSANTLVDQMMAAPLGEGSVTALTMGGRVVGFAIALVTTAVSAVLINEFGRFLARWEHDKLAHSLSIYNKLLLAAGIALTLFISLLSPQIIELIYGPHLPAATAHTFALIQICYALQIPFFLAGIAYVRYLSARGHNQYISRIAITNFIANIVLNFILAKFWGVYGIALATSLVYTSSYIQLRIHIHRQQNGR